MWVPWAQILTMLSVMRCNVEGFWTLDGPLTLVDSSTNVWAAFAECVPVVSQCMKWLSIEPSLVTFLVNVQWPMLSLIFVNPFLTNAPSQPIPPCTLQLLAQVRRKKQEKSRARKETTKQRNKTRQNKPKNKHSKKANRYKQKNIKQQHERYVVSLTTYLSCCFAAR